MPLPVALLLKTAASGIFTSVIKPYIEEAKEAAKEAAIESGKGLIESAITGKRTIEEWAEIAIKGVDTIKDRAVDEGGLSYVGGKLKFAISENNAGKIKISFELYFQDEDEKWHKISADSGVPFSGFTDEALEEIAEKGEVSFEVE